MSELQYDNPSILFNFQCSLSWIFMLVAILVILLFSLLFTTLVRVYGVGQRIKFEMHAYFFATKLFAVEWSC